MNPAYLALFLICLCLAVGLGVSLWCWIAEVQSARRNRARDSVAHARLEALLASQRIGLAFWRASQALRDAAGDSRRGRDEG